MTLSTDTASIPTTAAPQAPEAPAAEAPETEAPETEAPETEAAETPSAPTPSRTGTGEPPRSGLYRLGRWSARNPRRIAAGWLLLLIASVCIALVGVTGESLFQRLENGVPAVDGEAAAAQELLDAARADTGTELSLLVHGAAPDDPVLATTLDGLAAELDAVEAANPGAVVELVDPREAIAALDAGIELPADAAAAARRLVAADGEGVLLAVEVSPRSADDEADVAAADAAVDGALEVLDAAVAQISADLPEASAYASSDSRISLSYRIVAATDLERGEGIALPIALVIMVIVFGGFLAAGIPLVGAIASIGTGFGALYAMSWFMGFDSMVINVISLLGLALAIDYGLLVLSRYREELAGVERGDRTAREHAIATTVACTGRTVAFSGTIFAAASAGLLLFEPAIMRAIGIGVIIVVAITVLLVLTLVPALLALAGDRLARPGFLVRLLGERNPISRLGAPAPDDGFFGRLARWSQRRPAAITLGALSILALIASPALAMQATNDVSGALPRAASEYAFVETLRSEFPDAASPHVELVVRADGGDAEALAEEWAEALRGDERVASIGVLDRVGDYATIGLHPTDEGRLALVEAARDAAPAQPGVEAWVTGSAAQDVDLIDSVTGSLPWAAGLMLLVTFVLLFLMTGSVVMPLKSLFIAVFSLGSAVGLLVWGFQWGNLAGPLGFVAADVSGVDILVLTITLVLGFGLSMDYEVFLLGRVIELRDRGVDGREAVWRGVQGTGRIITSAALIMVVVFLGFTIGELLVIKQMGTALALLVALDATLVRLVLVPAMMTWQERIMWWSPRWLRPVAERYRIRH